MSLLKTADSHTDTVVSYRDFYSALFTIARAIIADRSENHVPAPTLTAAESPTAAIAVDQLLLSSKRIE